MFLARFVLFISSIYLSACSSFFYYPQQRSFVNPAVLPLKPEDVYFDTSDKVKLHGWYFKPFQGVQNAAPLSKAKILFFHGNAQNITTHFQHLYFLLHYRFEYFIFDYRGYGLSEGEPSPEGTVEDGLAALDWILRKDPDSPLIIFGQSLGGAVALKSLIRATSLPMRHQLEKQLKLVVIDSSFSDYKRVAADALSKSWLTWLFQPVAWLIVDNSQSPESELSQLTLSPLLVVHGKEDPVVSYRMGQRLFAMGADPKVFVGIEKGQHTDFLWREKGVNRRPFVDVLTKAVLRR